MVRQVQVQLSREQLINIFKKFDKDGDQKLTYQDLRAAFKSLNSRCGFYRAGQAINFADMNNDGHINLNSREFDKLIDYVSQCGYTIK